MYVGWFFMGDSLFLRTLKYAIVDIETTGGNFKTGRITEVAVYLHNGNKQIGSYTTLVNPEVPIPPFITHLTGISNEMVAEAPTFAEIARELRQVTENAIFVAHNVNFDYGYIREEFRKLGLDFKRKKLCTVQLSRQCFPGLASYSLDKITRELQIELPGHHRAAVDAFATMALFEKIITSKSEEGLFNAHCGMPDLSVFQSPFIDADFLNSIPDECGVYRFYDRADNLLYIKRADNMLTSICEKIKPNETQMSKDLQRDLHRIDYENTGSGLIAQLIEAHEVVAFKPIYNFGRFSMKAHYGLFAKQVGEDIHYTLLKRREGRKASAVFANFYEGLDFLKNVAARAGIEVTQLPNGRHSVPGLILPADQELQTENQKHYAIVDEGRKASERSMILVEGSVVRGYGFYDVDSPLSGLKTEELSYTFQDLPELEMVTRKFIEKKRYDTILNLRN